MNENENNIVKKMQATLKPEKRDFLISELYHLKNEEKFVIPEYQRSDVWSDNSKKALIDSILGGGVIPPIYFREIDGKYEIVDGLQRLWFSIFGFMNNEFTISGSEAPMLEGCTYTDLEEEYPKIFTAFNSRRIDVNILKDVTDEEVRRLFVLLNHNGEQATPGERIHAMGGFVKRTIDDLLKHPIFERITHLKRKRYDHYALISRMILFIRDSDVSNMMFKGTTSGNKLVNDIKQYVVQKIDKNIINEIIKVFDFINECLVLDNFELTSNRLYHTFIYVYVYRKFLKTNTFSHFLKSFWANVDKADKDIILQDTIFLSFKEKCKRSSSSIHQKEFLYNLHEVYDVINQGVEWYEINTRIPGWTLAQNIHGIL